MTYVLGRLAIKQETDMIWMRNVRALNMITSIRETQNIIWVCTI